MPRQRRRAATEKRRSRRHVVRGGREAAGSPVQPWESGSCCCGAVSGVSLEAVDPSYTTPVGSAARRDSARSTAGSSSSAVREEGRARTQLPPGGLSAPSSTFCCSGRASLVRGEVVSEPSGGQGTRQPPCSGVKIASRSVSVTWWHSFCRRSLKIAWSYLEKLPHRLRYGLIKPLKAAGEFNWRAFRWKQLYSKGLLSNVPHDHDCQLFTQNQLHPLKSALMEKKSYL